MPVARPPGGPKSATVVFVGCCSSVFDALPVATNARGLPRVMSRSSVRFRQAAPLRSRPDQRRHRADRAAIIHACTVRVVSVCEGHRPRTHSQLDGTPNRTARERPRPTPGSSVPLKRRSRLCVHRWSTSACPAHAQTSAVVIRRGRDQTQKTPQGVSGHPAGSDLNLDGATKSCPVNAARGRDWSGQVSRAFSAAAARTSRCALRTRPIPAGPASAGRSSAHRCRRRGTRSSPRAQGG